VVGREDIDYIETKITKMFEHVRDGKIFANTRFLE
jgi:hypothetical protein